MVCDPKPNGCCPAEQNNGLKPSGHTPTFSVASAVRGVAAVSARTKCRPRLAGAPDPALTLSSYPPSRRLDSQARKFRAVPVAMASTVTLSTQTLSRPPRRLQRAPQGSSAASTPNLNALYNASGHPASRDVSRLVPPPLARKGSLAALTSGSLATIPDATESYGTTTLSETPSKMGPLTPARSTGDGLAVGDAVDVPGNMHGTVRFIGTVAGRKGTFAGVELHPDYASRGKNSGDVDG